MIVTFTKSILYPCRKFPLSDLIFWLISFIVSSLAQLDLCFFICILCYCSASKFDYWHKNKKKAGKIKETIDHFDLIQRSNRSGDTLQLSKQHDPLELPIFDFDDILVATDHFNITNKLGQGGFGSVYKVIIFFSA